MLDEVKRIKYFGNAQMVFSILSDWQKQKPNKKVEECLVALYNMNKYTINMQDDRELLLDQLNHVKKERSEWAKKALDYERQLELSKL